MVDMTFEIKAAKSSPRIIFSLDRIELKKYLSSELIVP